MSYVHGAQVARYELGLEKIAVGEPHDHMPPVTGPGAKTMAGVGLAGLGALGLGAAGAAGALPVVATGLRAAAAPVARFGMNTLRQLRAEPFDAAVGAGMGGAVSAYHGNSPKRVAFDTMTGALTMGAWPGMAAKRLGAFGTQLADKFPKLRQAGQWMSNSIPKIRKGLQLGLGMTLDEGVESAGTKAVNAFAPE